MSTEQRPTKEELEAEIQELRQAVGETVEELTHRLDVKTRAKERIRSTSPAVPIGIVAALALGVGLVVWRRRAR